MSNFTEVSLIAISPSSENVIEVSVNNRLGFLLRGGLNLEKFILGLEFNYIPKTDIEIPGGQIIGTVSNSYVGLTFGYLIEIGKS